MSGGRSRDAQALALYRAAAPLDQIRSHLGFASDRAVQASLARSLARAGLERSYAEARLQELAQLDALHRVLWPRALEGDGGAIDRVLRVMDSRRALVRDLDAGSPLGEAFDRAVGELDLAPEDGALVATGRTVAGQIDSALRSGVSMERTKALYLVPHLVNVLRELGATPAARTQVKGKAAEVAAAEPPVGELGKLRALVGGRGKPQT